MKVTEVLSKLVASGAGSCVIEHCGLVKEYLSEDLVVQLLDQTDPGAMTRFDSYTDGKWRQQIVRRLVAIDSASAALGFLDDRCDEAAFQMAIRAAPANDSTYLPLKEAFHRMKVLGYRRTTREFEKVMCCCEPSALFDLFAEMRAVCEEAASPQCYKKVLHGCTHPFRALVVIQEAKSKGVPLDVSDYVIEILRAGGVGAVSTAAGLIVEDGRVDLVTSNVLEKLDSARIAAELVKKVREMAGRRVQPFQKTAETFLRKFGGC